MLDIELSLLELVARFVIIIFNNLMTPKTGLPHISIDSFLRFDSHLMCDGEEWIIYLPYQLLQEFKILFVNSRRTVTLGAFLPSPMSRDSTL